MPWLILLLLLLLAIHEERKTRRVARPPEIIRRRTVRGKLLSARDVPVADLSRSASEKQEQVLEAARNSNTHHP